MEEMKIPTKESFLFRNEEEQRSTQKGAIEVNASCMRLCMFLGAWELYLHGTLEKVANPKLLERLLKTCVGVGLEVVGRGVPRCSV